MRWSIVPGSLFALLSVALATPGQAGPLHYGARVGVNLASIRGDFADYAKPEFQSGLAAGGFATLALAPKIDLEMDVLYVQKGYKVVFEETDNLGNPLTAGILARLQYLDVPVVAKVSLPSWGVVSPYVVMGPNVAFALAGKSEAWIEEFRRNYDVTSDLERVVLGATAGVGFRLGTGPISFGVESRYTTDFTDLSERGNGNAINHGVSITAWAAR